MQSQDSSNTPKRDAEDLKFVVMNSLTHILEDIETHIKYGQDFNYEKDFKQIQSLVENLKNSVERF